MGAEALCRGAAVVVGVEQAAKACTVIRQNWQKLARPDQQTQILQMDVRRSFDQLAGRQFDRIYFDPPYASDLYESVITAIATHRLLSPTGVLAVEHHKHKWLPSSVGVLQSVQVRPYGTTALTFYKAAEASASLMSDP